MEDRLLHGYSYSKYGGIKIVMATTDAERLFHHQGLKFSFITFYDNNITNSAPSPSFVSTFISPPCALIIS